MGLVDPSILNSGGDALGQGFQSGLQIRQAMQKMGEDRADRQRKDKAIAAFQRSAQGRDITTPEGMKTAITGLAQAGFADEAARVYEAHKELFQKTPNHFSQIKGVNGTGSFNEQTGEQTLPPGFQTEEMRAADADKKFSSMKDTLDKFMTPKDSSKGWDPLSGEKGMALQKASQYMPADVRAYSVAAQKWMDDHNKEQQATVFNPAFAQGRDIPGLRTRSTGNAKTYKGAKDALNAAEGDYTNYLKDPNAPTNRVDQQGIIDKYTAVSLGKAPTEAQLELAQAFPGIESWFDLASGKLKTGQIIPKAAVDEMMRNMRKTVINYGSTLKQQNATDTEAANLGGVDPARILAIPDNVITQDSTRFANAPGQNPGAAKYSPMVINLAKKALADPNATAKHKADAKKILGLP